jgi:hypothetical protein
MERRGTPAICAAASRVYLKTNQQAYYDGLAGVQLREWWSEWIRFFAVDVEELVKESIHTESALEGILAEREEKIAVLNL